MPDVYAIIPARGGSKGVKRKNLKRIDGDPLVGIAAKHGLESETIDRTIVNSEDDEIRDVAASYGAEVMDRPAHLAHDDTLVDDLLQWFVEEREERGENIDVLTLLYPTAPLRTVDTIDETIRKVIEETFDSALTLYEDHSYLWKCEGQRAEPVNYNPQTRGPRQQEEWNQWVENKAVYAFEVGHLIETGCRLGSDIGFVEMPEWRSIDIDTPTELEMARFFSQNPPTSAE